nr:putative reverse transcriptase domain-containing protein [Tanacetum cinerariifolium]
MFFEEADKIEKYVGGLPDMIHGSVVASKPKTMQEAIEIATELMDKKIRTFAERETASKRKRECPKLKNNNNHGNQGRRNNAPARVYAVGRAGTDPDANVVTGCHVFLAYVTTKEKKDKSEKKRLEDVPIVRNFPEVMPFGLTNAPAVFIDLLNHVCKPYLDKFVIVFSDDIHIYSKNKKEQEEHLKAILEFLKKEEFQGIHVDLTKIEPIKDWASPKTPTKIRQFLGLAGYYQSAPILALPEGREDFVVYCDASHKGLGVVLMQREKVISNASCQLKIHEKNYTTHDLEVGSVVFALKLGGTICTELSVRCS